MHSSKNELHLDSKCMVYMTILVAFLSNSLREYDKAHLKETKLCSCWYWNDDNDRASTYCSQEGRQPASFYYSFVLDPEIMQLLK